MAFTHRSRALGAEGLPEEIRSEGRSFRRCKVFKHNSLAAVGLYERGGRKVVLKSYRQTPWLGLPVVGLSRLMARHEAQVIRRLQDLRGVPRLRGLHGPTGLVREYVPGHPLTRDCEVSRNFLLELFHLLRGIHRRGIAYVDLEKADNILVGEDGHPHLIDFQIAFHVPERFGGRTFPVRWLRRQFQTGDLYHARKHFRRLLEDRLTPRQLAYLRRKPWPVQLGNVLHTPFKKMKRCLLRKT